MIHGLYKFSIHADTLFIYLSFNSFIRDDDDAKQELIRDESMFANKQATYISDQKRNCHHLQQKNLDPAL